LNPPSNTVVQSAFVEFNLMDGSGSLVFNTIATANNIAPGQMWRFQAPIPDTVNYARWQMIKVTCY
jgi:hypothetical protein